MPRNARTVFVPALTLMVMVETAAGSTVVSATLTAITLPTRLNLALPCFQPWPGPPAMASGTSVSARAATTAMRSSFFTCTTSSVLWVVRGDLVALHPP